jgi:hypothetical protein
MMGFPKATPNHLQLYIPHPESRLCEQLAHGSAIVGLPSGHGHVRIYFEGNVIGAENLNRYRDKAIQAAGRMVHNYPAGYPTRAREDVDVREIIDIGTIEVSTSKIQISASPADLAWWIDPADIADLGLDARHRS